MYRYIFFLILPLLVNADLITSPIDVMKSQYAHNATITKKNIILTKEQAARVQQKAKVKLTTKIYRTYRADVNGTTLGHGVLVSNKVRSKKAAILYLFANDGLLLSTEVIAFNEPHEYIPSSSWLDQFDKTNSTENRLFLGKDIATISGSTLSARCITDSARIARALFEVMFLSK